MKHISQNNLDKIIALRHLLHSCPDLSLQESGTIGILKEFLQENTALEIVDRDGWFYAVKHVSAEPARVSPIAFRADMDALPMDESIALPYGSVREGVSHKCGHDGHMAALCGLALELDRMSVNRTVYLLFQPAEEIGRGAVRCADLIREKGITEIYAFHNLSNYPENSIVYRENLTQPASEGLTIRMYGKHSHASAPEDGRNPSAAIAELALYAQRLPEEPHDGMALCTIVGMQCGEGDFGISAGEGSVSVTLRAEQEPVMKKMEEKLLQKAEELSARDGLRTEHEIHDYFPETRNHEEALDRVILKAAGLQLPVIEMKDMWRASEDFGYYLKLCSGAMFYIGNGEEYPALHTDSYDFNDRILKTAVDMFLALADKKDLSKYDDTTVRIVSGSGETFSGACAWFPPEFGLSEFGLEEESLRIGDYVFFERDIREIELLREEAYIPVRDWPEAKEEIAAWFHEKWHVPLEAYRESISDCLRAESGVPQWYVVVRDSRIIAGCGVIENDFHERKDLAPNVCAVYVDEEYRNRGIAGFMLQYVCEDMSAMGIDTLYLLTDHIGFYERYGWEFLCMARGSDGELSRMYMHHI